MMARFDLISRFCVVYFGPRLAHRLFGLHVVTYNDRWRVESCSHVAVVVVVLLFVVVSVYIQEPGGV